MDVLAAYLTIALVAGFGAATLRLPPLVGFLAAGFILGALGVPPLPHLQTLADAGVTVLLFTIGLTFNARTFLQRHVWATAVLHMALTTALLAGFLGLVLSVVGAGPRPGLPALALVGFALSFSSTVFVVKALQERRAEQSLYGRTAIGILLLQDVAAVVFLAAEGQAPSPWAGLLVLAFPLAWAVRHAWDHVAHNELELLFGITIALVPGYFAFSQLGVRGDLGALVMGLLLAPHPRAADLAARLMSLKDVLLVAFFVSIGLHGAPTATQLLVAAALVVMLPFKSILYIALLRWGRLRNRTSTLSGVVLGNYSEFGLIVAAVGAARGLVGTEWVVTLALAVAGSLALSSLVNRRGSALAGFLAGLLPNRPEHKLHPEDRHIDIGAADAVVLGMGRVGAAAYDRLTGKYGVRTVGIESSGERAAQLAAAGRRVIEGDATDEEFWERVRRTGQLSLAIVAMSQHGSNLDALDRLRRSRFSGTIAVVVQNDDEAVEAAEQGAQTVLHLYEGAGSELADRAVAQLHTDE